VNGILNLFATLAFIIPNVTGDSFVTSQFDNDYLYGEIYIISQIIHAHVTFVPGPCAIKSILVCIYMRRRIENIYCNCILQANVTNVIFVICTWSLYISSLI
jgi:hypothetical protein